MTVQTISPSKDNVLSSSPGISRSRLIISGTPAGACDRVPPLRDDLDSTLVSQAQGGDWEAFATLVERHRKFALRTIMKIVQQHEDAEDALQETLFKAYSNINRFRGDSKFSTWLIRIAMNQSLMCLRKRNRTLISIDNIEETENGRFSFDIPELRPNPEQQCVAAQIVEGLIQEIEQLPGTCRAAFELRAIDELTTQQAATALGISVPALKSRVLRAGRHLRRNLDSRYPTIRFKSSEPAHSGARANSTGRVCAGAEINI